MHVYRAFNGEGDRSAPHGAGQAEDPVVKGTPIVATVLGDEGAGCVTARCLLPVLSVPGHHLLIQTAARPDCQPHFGLFAGDPLMTTEVHWSAM